MKRYKVPLELTPPLIDTLNKLKKKCRVTSKAIADAIHQKQIGAGIDREGKEPPLRSVQRILSGDADSISDLALEAFAECFEMKPEDVVEISLRPPDPAPIENPSAQLEELGIIRVSPTGIIPVETLFKAQKEIRIIQLTGIGFLRTQADRLKHALNGGLKIRVAILDKDCPYLFACEKLMDKEQPDADHHVKEVTKTLKRIGKRKTNGELQLGFHTLEFRCFLAIADDSWGWLTLNLPPKPSPETASLELKKGVLLEDSIEYFEKVWEKIQSEGRVYQLNHEGMHPISKQTARQGPTDTGSVKGKKKGK